MNIPWPLEIREFIQEMLESKRYEYEGEILLEAMFLLREQELLRKAKIDDLRIAVQKGIDDMENGRFVDGEEAFKAIRERHKDLFDRAS